MVNLKNRGILASGLAAIIFCLLSFWWFQDMIFYYPRGIHEWAQADRLALALSFYDNGFNFFKPATFNLSSENGITGVEFPLQAYLAALGGLVAGQQNISLCFRLITILFSLAGFLYLFKYLFSVTHNFFISITPGIFLLASPVFAFYTCNYLPDTASASLLFIAFYYLHIFVQKESNTYLVLVYLLPTLASLIKITAGIYFMAFSLFVFYHLYFTKKLRAKGLIYFWILNLSGLGLVIAHTLYNQYLNSRYQAYLFLAKPQPVKDWEMFRYIKERILTIWQFEYFTSPQYYLILVCLVGFVIFGFQKRNQRHPLFIIIILTFLGGICFFLLMGAQFIDHDYYFIVAYMPLVIFILVAALITFQEKLQNKFGPTLIGLFLVPSLVMGFRQHQYRNAPTYKTFSDYYTYPWMEGGSAALAKANIPQAAKILVLEGDAPNLALVYFDRKGIIWKPDFNQDFWAQVATFQKKYGLDYLISKQTDLQNLQKESALFNQHLQLIIQTDKFGVYKFK